MSDYVGMICPYCKTPLKDNDDIVVCSDCEMPHHKDCWVYNQGCTTFGCSGTISVASDNKPLDIPSFEIEIYDEVETSQENDFLHFVYCSKCGTRHNNTDKFCCDCGSRIDNKNYCSNDNYINASNAAKNYEALIGENTEYYLEKFEILSKQNTKISWNWSAFLITPLWLAYRKMYVWAGVFVVILILMNLMFGIEFFIFLSIAVYIAFGLTGNYIYMKKLEKTSLQMYLLTDSYKTEYINKNGGTSTYAAVIIAIISFVLNMIVQFI